MVRSYSYCLLALITAVLMPAVAWASGSTTAAPKGQPIDGVVVDQQTGLAIANAVVSLFRGTLQVATTTTDRDGDYVFDNETPGIYHVDISAVGYGTVRSGDITLNAAPVFTTTMITQQTTHSQTPRQLATIMVNSGSRGLQTTTVIQSDVSTDLIHAEGYSRAGDALLTLPDINPSPNGVHGSTIGYSLPLDIRGIGSNETQVLFDGHPVGAAGANAFPGQAFFNQAPVLYDFQDSPSDALRNIQVTYGSGAVGLYGVDSIGGIIDEQSIDPTADQHFTFTQGLGSYGKALTNFQATGTLPDKLGYAIGSGVTGTFGEFPPGQQTQTGLIGSNQTSANLAANTYFVSGDYVQRDTLGKLTYPISTSTKLTLTGYSATSWSDKSGEGDDDYVTYPYQLLVGQGIINNATDNMTSITGENGQTFTCTGAIAAINDAHPNGVCETPAQYAAATTGPQGGGNGPWQALRTDDYHARLTTTLGAQNFAFDTFVDNFGGIYSRVANLLGSQHENIVVTRGALISDSLALTQDDDLGFGYYSQVQKITGTNLNLSTNAEGNPYLQPTVNPEVAADISNFFLRDAYTPSRAFGVYLNGWEKYNSVSHSSAFDPRLSLVLSPTPQDVVRLTGGRSTDAPFIGLQEATTQFNTDTTNIQPACGGLTIVGSAGNPDIQSVTGTDFELAYGHRFQEDTSVQLSLYDTTLTDPIFDSTIPATEFEGNPGLAALIAALNGTTSNPGRYEQICNIPATANNLGLAGPVNVGGGVFRGVNLGGRVRFTPQLRVDYGYNVQIAEFTGVSASLLQSNPFLINDAQIAGIAPHTAMLGIDDTNAKGGNEIHFDANYVSANNTYYIGSYTYVNGFVRQALTKDLTLNVGGYNIFDAYSYRYGLIGWGLFQPENQYFHDSTVAEEAYNEGLPENIGEGFGIPPPQVTVSVTYHI